MIAHHHSLICFSSLPCVRSFFFPPQSEASNLYANKLSNSSSWTVGDLASVAVVGTQLVGCFCIGEILARGMITGYPQGAAHH
jgi:hypothetical protein